MQQICGRLGLDPDGDSVARVTPEEWSERTNAAIDNAMRLGRVIELRKHTSLELYRRGKPDKKLEPYLNDRGNLPGSWLKCRIRSGSLQTRDFSGRILNRPISERLCPFGCPQR